MAYHTKQQDIILSCLENYSGNALSVDEIEDLLKENGLTVGKTTIYRYLLKYEKSGEVMKITPPGSKSALFQLINRDSRCHEHLHLRCSSCGKTFHLDCSFMHELEHHISRHHSFKADYNTSIIYGTCENCEGAL